MEIPITINSSQKLYGIYHWCDNSQATVITIHGLYGSRVDSHRLCVEFARNSLKHNISCLRVDLTGSGISQGNFIDFTFNQQIEDTKNIIDWLKRQSKVRRIYLLGLSDGAITAYHVGAYNDDINGIIFWSPRFSTENKSNGAATLKRLYKVNDSWAWAVSGNWLYKDYYKDKQHLIDLIDFNSFQKNSLAIYGTSDLVVKECIEKIVAKNLQKCTIEDGDHMYLSPQWTHQVIEETIKWIEFQVRKN